MRRFTWAEIVRDYRVAFAGDAKTNLGFGVPVPQPDSEALGGCRPNKMQ